jgi:hypothetical protein
MGAAGWVVTPMTISVASRVGISYIYEGAKTDRLSNLIFNQSKNKNGNLLTRSSCSTVAGTVLGAGSTVDVT